MVTDINLYALAKKYNALEQIDSSDFQCRARILQSVWREEKGYRIGEHISKSGIRPLGSRLPMPWAEQTLNNFLTDTIRQVVQNEIIDAKRIGKLYGKPRIFNDLLSSQPLAFNLFAELKEDLIFATEVFKTLTDGHVQSVKRIEFEHSPGRRDLRYTGDRSAFDVYVIFETAQHCHGFIGIEVKYHENLKSPKRKNNAHFNNGNYELIAEFMNCFKQEAMDCLRMAPLEQIWRDHLLAGSILRQDKDQFDEGLFVFLYPQDNPHCKNAITAYRKCLSNFKTFESWTLENVAATIKKHTSKQWIDCFIDRYLNFDKLLKL